MTRDSFASEQHFLDRIESLERGIDSLQEKLAAGGVRRPDRGRRMLWKRRSDILECRYSLGVPVDELRPDFAALVAALAELDADAFDASRSDTDYDTLVTLASWAVMLDDTESGQIVADVAASSMRLEGRLVDLLVSLGVHSGASESGGDFGLYGARDAQLAADPTLASQLLYKFVNEEWFQAVYNSGFRPLTHTGEMSSHVGYWCYVAGGYAKAFGMDDTRLQGHKYYPWDLRNA